MLLLRRVRFELLFELACVLKPTKKIMKNVSYISVTSKGPRLAETTVLSSHPRYLRPQRFPTDGT